MILHVVIQLSRNPAPSHCTVSQEQGKRHSYARFAAYAADPRAALSAHPQLSSAAPDRPKSCPGFLHGKEDAALAGATDGFATTVC